MTPAPTRVYQSRARQRLVAVLALQLAIWGSLEGATFLLFFGPLAPWRVATASGLTPGLHLALFTIGFEIASGTLALWLASGPPRAPALAEASVKVSVLVAAYDEAAGIAATVRSIRAQSGVELDLIVADDGSSDGTAAVLVDAFALEPAPELPGYRSADGRLRVLVLSHRGKGSALNAAIAAARHPLCITVDADTLLAPLALARLAAAFVDPAVQAATGSVLVARTPNLLTRFQQIEYVRNTLIRVAWAGLAALEQLPGAFMAVRTDWLRAVGGYPTASFTEDYELVYRLYARAATQGLPLMVAAVPTACAYTDAPATLRPLLRQRTRWFAGFLATLWRYRRLIGNPRAGVFGVVKLPIKVVDAIHPLLSLLSLVILVAGIASAPLRPMASSLFALRWAWDSFTLAMALRFARRAGAEVDLGRAAGLWPWVFVLADGISYFWLRQLAVLQAYPRVLGPERSWKSTRPGAPVALGD